MVIEASKDPDHGSSEKGVHYSPLSGWGWQTESFVTVYRVKTATPSERVTAVVFAEGKEGWIYDTLGALTGDKEVNQPKGIGYYCTN